MIYYRPLSMNAVLRSWSPTQMRSPVAIEEGHQLSIRILERLQDLLTSHVQHVVDKVKASAFRHGSTVALRAWGLLAFSVIGPQACSYLGIYGIYYLDSDMISPFGLKKSMDTKGAKAEISHCPKKTMFIPSWIPKDGCRDTIAMPTVGVIWATWL